MYEMIGIWKNVRKRKKKKERERNAVQKNEGVGDDLRKEERGGEGVHFENHSKFVQVEFSRNLSTIYYKNLTKLIY